MAADLPVNFPSQAEQLRLRVESEKRLTLTERMHALLDALDAAERLSLSGTQREHQLAYHRHREKEWQEFMRRFITEHDPN